MGTSNRSLPPPSVLSFLDPPKLRLLEQSHGKPVKVSQSIHQAHPPGTVSMAPTGMVLSGNTTQCNAGLVHSTGLVEGQASHLSNHHQHQHLHSHPHSNPHLHQHQQQQKQQQQIQQLQRQCAKPYLNVNTQEFTSGPNGQNAPPLSPYGTCNYPTSTHLGLGQLPTPPPNWQEYEDGMRHWLYAKVEEERRRQEEERSRQESLRLEQRRIEQAMLRDSLQGNVPPHLIPLMFSGLAGATQLPSATRATGSYQYAHTTTSCGESPVYSSPGSLCSVNSGQVNMRYTNMNSTTVPPPTTTSTPTVITGTNLGRYPPSLKMGVSSCKGGGEPIGTTGTSNVVTNISTSTSNGPQPNQTSPYEIVPLESTRCYTNSIGSSQNIIPSVNSTLVSNDRSTSVSASNQIYFHHFTPPRAPQVSGAGSTHPPPGGASDISTLSKKRKANTASMIMFRPASSGTAAVTITTTAPPLPSSCLSTTSELPSAPVLNGNVGTGVGSNSIAPDTVRENTERENIEDNTQSRTVNEDTSITQPVRLLENSQDHICQSSHTQQPTIKSAGLPDRDSCGDNADEKV